MLRQGGIRSAPSAGNMSPVPPTASSSTECLVIAVPATCFRSAHLVSVLAHFSMTWQPGHKDHKGFAVRRATYKAENKKCHEILHWSRGGNFYIMISNDNQWD